MQQQREQRMMMRDHEDRYGLLKHVEHELASREPTAQDLLWREKREMMMVEAGLHSKVTLATYSFVGLAIIAVAVFTYFMVRDVLPDSVTIGVLLLISVLVGLGTVLYGVLQSRVTLQIARQQGLMQGVEALAEQERQRKEQTKSFVENTEQYAEAEPGTTDQLG
jgi:hypothetical protein